MRAIDKRLLALSVLKVIEKKDVEGHKFILIEKVVKVLFDQQEAFGIVMLPRTRNTHEHDTRKEIMKVKLQNRYRVYLTRDASVSDIITDFLSEAQKMNIAIVQLLDR